MNNVKLLAIAFVNGKGNCFKSYVILKLQPDGKLSVPGLPVDSTLFPGVNDRIIKGIDPSTTLIGDDLVISDAWAVTHVPSIDTLLSSQIAVFKNSVRVEAEEFINGLVTNGSHKIVPFDKFIKMKDSDFYEGHKEILLQHYTSQDSPRIGLWRDAV